jgi:hypothetical protein
MTNPNFSPIESTKARWAGDYFSRLTVMPVPILLDAAQFNAVDAVKVVVGANAAVDATSVTVAALSGPIPNGEVIDMGGKKFARLTAAAAKGAVSLTVAPLATALVTNDTGTYKGVGKKSIPSGILVGRTYAERDAGTAWGPAVVETDDEIYLTVRELPDLTKDATNEIYRHNKVVKENYLPQWATYSNAVKAKIRSLYACIGGKD